MTSVASPSLTATDRWGAWDRFLATSPATGFMQSSWWAEFRSLYGYRHFGAVIRNGQTVIGGAVVMKLWCSPDRCFYYIPDGPVLGEDPSMAADVFEGVLEQVEEERRSEPGVVSHLRIEPRWPEVPDFVQDFHPVPVLGDSYMEPRDTLCIDLRPSEDAILAQMKPKGRYNVRLAQRHGVSVVDDTSEQGLEDFLGIYSEMAARQGIGQKPPSYFEDLVSALSFYGAGSLVFAEHEGVRVAGALVVHFGRRATYFYGGSLDTHRHVMAPYLLHFEIMRRSKALGCDWYDFWGIAPENEPDHPWQDITTFKRKFGGVELHLVPTLDHVFDRAAYDEYVAWTSAGG